MTPSVVPPSDPVPVPPLRAVLGAAAAGAATSLGEDAAWVNSEFAWLRTLPPRTKARAGAQIVELLLRGAGYPVTPRTDPGHDRTVASVPVVVKFSTLWSQGTYVFQKLRPGTWEQAILLGVSPHTAHAWLLPAGVLAAHAARSEDWLTVDPAAPPAWLTPLGGPLETFASRLGEAFGSPVAPHGPASVNQVTDTPVRPRRGDSRGRPAT